jgi:hypothetical protein
VSRLFEQELVRRQREALLALFPVELCQAVHAPNFHTGTHVPEAPLDFGILLNISALYFEMRHRLLKAIITNYRNIHLRIFEIDSARQALIELIRSASCHNVMSDSATWVRLKQDPAFKALTSFDSIASRLAGHPDEPIVLNPIFPLPSPPPPPAAAVPAPIPAPAPDFAPMELVDVAAPVNQLPPLRLIPPADVVHVSPLPFVLPRELVLTHG